ncbi:MAG: HDOD domain-containing protein [Thermoguttaceae bacterium]
MPNSAMNVLKLGNDPTRVNLDDLVRPIEADAGLAAQVLKFFNSSYFGFQSEISSVRQGIALVGIRVVKNFVLWKAVFSLIPKVTAPHFRVADLWQDSLRRAMFSRFMAMEIKLGDTDVAFAGTLLSDMAVPLLLKRMPDEYGAVLEEVFAMPGARLSTIERNRFGWTHADAAATLAEIWKLPEQLGKIVANHGDTDIVKRGPAKEIIEQQIAVVASFLPMTIREEWQEHETFLDLSTTLGGESLDIEDIFAKIDKEYEQYAAILSLPKPHRTLVDLLNAC